MKKRLKQAAALGYDAEKDKAPTVLALGKGKLAEKIIEIARLHGVPVHEDQNLVELLSHVQVGQEIPAELYMVVAQVLAFIYQIDEEYRLVKVK